MACYSRWYDAGGGAAKRLFSCGRCIGCRLEYSRQWAVRMLHESQLHDFNCFLTLSYASTGFSLVPRDLTLFLKRLRARFPSSRFRYYACGEYGELYSRPHFHVCLFGFDFPDKFAWSRAESGYQLYKSELLDKIWGHGHCTIGAFTFETAAYCSRYVTKKLVDFDDAKAPKLAILDPDTGELFFRTKEFSRMSRRPAIGLNWYRKFKSDVYPDGQVVINGVKARAPRFYDKMFRAGDAGAYMKLSLLRKELGVKEFSELSDERLNSREIVAKARSSNRTFE